MKFADLNFLWREQEEAFNAIAEIADYSAMTEEQQNQYDDALRELQDTYSTLLYSWKTGQKNGLRKGRKEGRRQGRKEGRRQGRKDDAQRMIAKGMDDSIISEITQLPVAEIQKMRNSHNSCQ